MRRAFLLYNKIMSIEIEIKAHVNNMSEIKEKLDQKFSFVTDFLKEDIYFRGINSLTEEEKELRLRKTRGGYIVTYKERTHHDKTEVNVEKEFTIDDSEAFIYMINKLGYSSYIEKIKEGWLYKDEPVNIELSNVKSLGWFIEIEYIAKDYDELGFAKSKIYGILDDLGVSRENIEDKYYLQLLEELKNEEK